MRLRLKSCVIRLPLLAQSSEDTIAFTVRYDQPMKIPERHEPELEDDRALGNQTRVTKHTDTRHDTHTLSKKVG